MHTHSPEQLRKGYLSALVVVAIWTGFIVTSRMAGKSTLNPYDLIALRYIVAAIGILPFYLRYRPRLWEWRKLVLCATGLLGFTLLAFHGFHLTIASHAGILMQGFLPFSVSVMAYFLAGERPNRQRLMGLALIFIGVAAMAVDSFSGDDFSTTLIGDGFMLSASLCWALYTVLLRRWNFPPLDCAIAVTMLAAIIYLPIYFLFLPQNIAGTPWHVVAFHGFYQGLMVAVVQMIFYTRAVSQLGATRLAMVTSTVPVLASLVAVPVLNEALTAPIIIGLIFVVLGAYLGNRQPKIQVE
jgi:drug/metabolite transporter (DMT)-like permease